MLCCADGYFVILCMSHRSVLQWVYCRLSPGQVSLFKMNVMVEHVNSMYSRLHVETYQNVKEMFRKETKKV